MQEANILYFDGNSARPSLVRVLLFNRQVQVHGADDDRLIQSFPLAGTAYNKIGATHYLYLDAQGLMYLQFKADHPLVPQLAQGMAEAHTSWGQKLMRQKITLLLALVVVLSLGLYVALVNLVPFIGTRLIGVEQEMKMGEKLKGVMLKEAMLLGAAIDTAGTQHLQAFADELKLSDRYPIRVTLLKSNIVNAYALPGGQVVVYSGILQKIKTPEALAALLAHESSHINQRHSLKSLLRSSANGILISVLFSDATGISGALVSNAESLNGLRYSRSLETEADAKGMDLLLANGVPVKGMRQLMQTLQQEGDVPGNLFFLSSHPLTKERLRAADGYIKKHPQPEKELGTLKQLFEKLKEE